MTIKTTYDINSLCEDLVTLSKKEGLLFSKNIMFFVVYMKSKPIAFFGLNFFKVSGTNADPNEPVPPVIRIVLFLSIIFYKYYGLISLSLNFL